MRRKRQPKDKLVRIFAKNLNPYGYAEYFCDQIKGSKEYRIVTVLRKQRDLREELIIYLDKLEKTKKKK